MLPKEVPLAALMEPDRYIWVDKQIRATKGNWQKTITVTFNEVGDISFRKRKFVYDDEEFG